MTKEDVLRRMNKERGLLHSVKYRKTSYLGHVFQNEKNYNLQLLIEGKIERKRPIERERMSYVLAKNYEEFRRTDRNCRK